MRNQINIILFVIILGLIILNIGLYLFYSNNVVKSKVNEEVLYQRFGNSLENGLELLPYVYNHTVDKSLAFLLDYYAMSNNSIYCLSNNICTNVTQDLYNYFDKLYGNNWNLTIYIVPNGFLGWIVKMFVVTGNEGDWDVCAFNPPNNPQNISWYEIGYNASFMGIINESNQGYNGNTNITGAGWVYATNPFAEYNSFSSWGLPDLVGSYGNDINALKNGYCEPLSYILPQYNFTNATIYCPHSEWPLWEDSSFPPTQSTNSLPSFFSGEYDQISYYYYLDPQYYKTVTDISTLAYILGIINDYNTVVGSFYIGNVTILPQCQQVFMDVLWHEVERVYISYINTSGQPTYVFLSADPLCDFYYNNTFIKCPTGIYDNFITENISGINITIGKQCPLVYQIGQNTFSWGLYRFNITKWVIYDRDPNTNYFEIANAYWDPHPGSNGVSDIAVYCITNNGQVIYLNQNPYGFTPQKISIGYPIPQGISYLSFQFYYPIEISNIPVYIVAQLSIW